jgi:hypothetical protein
MARNELIKNSSGPALGAAAITPGTPFAQTCRAIYVGGDGAVVATMEDGTNITFAAAKAGSVLPIRATQVVSSGTTASNLVALF